MLVKTDMSGKNTNEPYDHQDNDIHDERDYNLEKHMGKPKRHFMMIIMLSPTHIFESIFSWPTCSCGAHILGFIYNWSTWSRGSRTIKLIRTLEMISLLVRICLPCYNMITIKYLIGSLPLPSLVYKREGKAVRLVC